MEQELVRKIKYYDAIDKLVYSREKMRATQFLCPTHALLSKLLKSKGYDEDLLYRLISCSLTAGQTH
jgi:hypothetical protein